MKGNTAGALELLSVAGIVALRGMWNSSCFQLHIVRKQAVRSDFEKRS